MPSKKGRWLKCHARQYQFQVPFMLYPDFENILKVAEEQYRENANQMKAE